MTPRVAIIGAGLAGLTAAHRLLAKNVEVAVIDKGRHGGGRMCTRAVELPDGTTARFDIGPPLLYQRLPSTRAMPLFSVMNIANELFDTPLFQPRAVGRIGASGEVVDDEIGYGGVSGVAALGGMRELAFQLLAAHRDAIEFHDHTSAEKLERTEDGWRIHTRSLRDDSERIVTAHGLILTPPVPQTLELLQRNKIALPDQHRYSLQEVTYSRCIAVYGVFTGGDPLQPGGVWFGDGPLEWITDNHRKDVSEVPFSITAIASHDWATEHWDEPDARLLEQLLPRLEAWVGVPVDTAQVGIQKWQWAKPLTPLLTQCAVLRDLNAVIAGDGFAGAVVDPADAAVVSGEAAAVRMAALLTELARRSNSLTVAPPKRYKLEIAVTTPAEARIAESHGADRLELSSGLEVGGLTPSWGLFRAVRRQTKLPLYVLLRPRAGGFVYSLSELAVMEADAKSFLERGADGIVFGALTGDGRIDRPTCERLVAVAHKAEKKAVFHRAFDFLENQCEALEELIELGFERVLTSGGATTAEAGANRLATLVQHAGWQIEVLPAGNVRPHNVAELVHATQCDQVHSAARVEATDELLARHGRLGQSMGQPSELSAELVAGLRQQLDLAAEPV